MGTKKFHSFVQTVKDLTSIDRKNMYEIMQQHFFGITPEIFNADLDEKDWVVRVNNSLNEIQGFTTIKLLKQEFKGEIIYGFYSGDTVLSLDALGDPGWISAWGDFVFSHAESLRPAKSYWVFTTSTIRTYEIISSCYKDFIPSPFAKEDADKLLIMQNFITQKYHNVYDALANLVILPQAVSYKESEILNLNFNHKREVTNHFYQLNPNYRSGNMLGCMAEVIPNNLTRIGLRVVFGEKTEPAIKA
jgi:hypothetical protein